MDWPKQGASVPRDIVMIRGWAASRHQAARRVVVTVDGQVHASARVGRRRVDVSAHLRDPLLLNSGFEVAVDLSSWPRDEARITVAAQGGDESELAVIADFPLQLVAEATGTRVRGALDWPPAGASVRRGVVRVAGWAAGDEGPVDGVEILLDGKSQGLARLGLPRRDLVDLLNRPHALMAGFEHLLDLSSVDDGGQGVTIAARALSRGGKAATVGMVTIGLTPARRVSAGEDSRGTTLRKRSLASSLEHARGRTGVRLLAVTHHLGLGGGQLYLAELLEKMHAGHDFPCTVVAPGDGPLRHRMERQGITVHITAGYPLAGVDEYEGKVTELAALAMRGAFTHVLVNTLGAFIGADLGARLGLPVIWAVHESVTLPRFWTAAYPENLPHQYVRDRAEHALRKAHTVIFEAEATRRLLDPWVAGGRSLVVPYGVDNRQIARYCARVSRAAARRSLNLPEEDTLLLCLATIEPRKGQILIAEAFARTAAVTDRPGVMVLVGDQDTPYSQALKQFIAWRGIGDRILVEPVAEKAYRWYRASDVLVSAADLESMPRSMLEAMSFGLPIAATDVFGVGELLTDGETGLLAKAGCLSELDALLLRVAKMSDEERREMGDRGRALVQGQHDSSGYAQVYRGLLGL